MTDRIHLIPRPIAPAGAQGSAGSTGNRGASSSGGASFGEILGEQMGASRLQFSRHAQSRLESRGITLGAEQMTRLENAVRQVGEKGGRDSLVLLDDTALVVSVKNNTVVTAVDREQLKGNVFTNIDSAVIA